MSSNITIYIKNLEDKKIPLEINLTDTIKRGKDKYKTKTTYSNNLQWKFNAKVLNDTKTFDFYGIEDDDIIISNDRNEGGINLLIKT